MVNSKSKLWLALTIILGIVTTILVTRYLNDLKNAALPKVMTTVVVASTKIPMGTRITPEMVKTIEVPAEYVHKEAARKPENVVKQFAAVDFVQDEAIITSQLTSEKTSNQLSFKIPPGTRAITTPINPPSGVAGHVKPGDYIDIILTYKRPDKGDELVVTTMLKKIFVLAIGGDLQKKDGVQAAETITLAVSPNDAQLITMAESVGKLKLTLRPAAEEKDSPLKGMNIKDFTAMLP